MLNISFVLKENDAFDVNALNQLETMVVHLHWEITLIEEKLFLKKSYKKDIPYSTLSSPPLNDRHFAKLGGEGTRQRWFLFSEIYIFIKNWK